MTFLYLVIWELSRIILAMLELQITNPPSNSKSVTHYGKILTTFKVLKHDLITSLVTLKMSVKIVLLKKILFQKYLLIFCDSKRFAWLELPNCESIKQRLVHVSTMQNDFYFEHSTFVWFPTEF